MKVINCCPHEVAVIEGSVYDPATRKNRGGKEVLRVPKSGIVASARSSIEPVTPILIGDISVPACKRTFDKVTELPTGGDFYIVSSLYAQAVKELGGNVTNLLVPLGSVVNEQGEIIGCTGLVRCA